MTTTDERQRTLYMTVCIEISKHEVLMCGGQPSFEALLKQRGRIDYFGDDVAGITEGCSIDGDTGTYVFVQRIYKKGVK